MSAPTSLSLGSSTSTKMQEAGMYSSCHLKSSIGELSSISENGKTSPRMMDSLSPQDKLIETKFNELARKILEELRQAQYSREFFKTIDEIIKEPISKTFASKATTIAARPRRPNHQRYINNNNNNSSTNYGSSRQQQARGEQFQYNNSSAADQQQPRSLPLDVTHLIQQQHLKQLQLQKQQLQLHQQKQQQQQQMQHSAPQQRPQKSAIPTISGGHNGYSSPKKSITAAEDKVATQNNSSSYPLSRSSTIGEANMKRQQQLNGLRKSSTVIHNNNNNNNNFSSHNQEVVKAKANDTTSANTARTQKTDMFSKLVSRRSIDEDEDDGDDDEEEEEEDDDDDEEDEDDYEPEIDSRQRDLYQNNQRFNPIAKSKTLSDTTNISEMNNMPTKKTVVQPRLQLQPEQQQQAQKVKQRFNPIVRSNTISASSSQRPANHNNHHHHQHQRELQNQNSSEPKSMVLNSRDIGSLYKPHMNYSTSVLGTHRLSDDDEIIIIPTQSPSLVSTSPDGDANVDELTERFSISRTKSFWEKLSKGTHGRRTVNENFRCENGPPGATSAQNSTKISQHHHHQGTPKASKVGGSRLNGHSHTLDRMDSTGGSNSNYSCSSSGDENSGCHSQQNAATASQLQELSRQNRFRQTR